MNIETGNTAGWSGVPSGRPSRFEKLVPNPKAKLRDQFHEVMRFKHFSERTEKSYWQWVVRYLKFHRLGEVWQHPKDLKAAAKKSAGWLRVG